MEEPELQRLVAAIGEEILARLGKAPAVAAADSGACCQQCGEGDAAVCADKVCRVVAAGAGRVSCCPAVARAQPSIAALIDHTLLRPEATRSDILRLCAEARQYGFASVCVNPYWVPLAAEALRGTSVKVCTVAGFPLGAAMTEIKRAEAEAAVRTGATEVDMVINIGALRSGDYDAVKTDIQSVVEICHRAGALVKVILETALLDDRQKVIACVLARLAGADFVKTSTGFGPGGATVQDVALMRQVVGPEVGVKAAGGIRTLEDLRRMVAAGATRIGASASVRIVEAAA
ncbi:MAG: deoxyribose-phosphate aldolase [Bryobacterales bacterium]|nr:deoxyribose-phosphate aldolase [Bryobacteraceae bacterium]MDW8353316.1 deoxyribose-phosphate aldolase [Bryobacterales bacterium]